MKSINQWFAKQKKRNERFVSIQEFFFSNRSFDYVLYRLKILNIQLFIRYLFFCLMIYFLYGNLSNKHFTLIIIVSTIKTLFSKYWWGLLETLRAKVRHGFYAHMNHEVDKEIGAYLVFAILIALVLAMSSYALLSYYEISHHMDLSIHYYFLFSIVSLFLFIILRTYHSGIYALTRIIRTPASVISADMLGIIVLLIFLPEYRHYAWLLAIITRTLLSYFLTWHFSVRMYHFYKITPEWPSSKSFKRWLTHLPLFEMQLSGLSYMVIQSDFILIPIMIYLLKYGLISNQWFVFIYLIYPMVMATSAWSVLFYFDRKKIRGSDFAKVMIYYNDILSRLSPFLAILYWGLACLAMFVFFKSIYLFEMITFLPFFILKAKLSDYLIKRFSYRGYWDILWIYCMAGMLFLGIYWINLGLFMGFLEALGAMLLLIKLAKRPLFKPQPNLNMFKLPIGFYNFLLKLGHASTHSSVSVYLIMTDNLINANQTYGLLDKISRIFVGHSGEICFYDDRQFLFFTLDRVYHRKDIIKNCYGLARTIKHVYLNDKEAYLNEVANPQGFFSVLFPNDLYHIKNKIPMDSLLANFRKNYPEGIIFHPQPELGHKAYAMPQYEVRSIYIAIIHYLYHTKTVLKSSYEFSCAYSNYRIEYIFAIPKKEVGNKRIERWLKTINVFNLLEATRDIDSLPDANQILAD